MTPTDQPTPPKTPTSTGRTIMLTLLPAAVALASSVGIVFPEDIVWSQIAAATLLAAPPFVMLLWPIWSFVVFKRTNRWCIPLAGGLMGLALSGVPPAWLQQPSEGFRLVVANVNAYPDTPQVEELQRDLGNFQADVLVVIEQRPTQIPGMVLAADNFDDDLPRISHATAIFCRTDLPTELCQAHVTKEFGSESFKMPLGLVRVGEKACIMGIHGPPPAPKNATGLRPYVQRVADSISNGMLNQDWGPCRSGDRVVVAGDLNAPPGHAVHRLLLSRGLADELKWFGVWAATWPSGGGWPNMPYYQLDQVLSGGIDVQNISFHRLPGSDHKALAMDLLF